jgi:hypothetical protein
VAPRKVKPKVIPAWLYDLKGGAMGSPLFPFAVCLWLCSGCGAPYFFRQYGSRHGGPGLRIIEHPEWSPALGPCWRSKEYGVKCVTPRGARVLYHEKQEPPDAAFIDKLTKGAAKRTRELRKEEP